MNSSTDHSWTAVTTAAALLGLALTLTYSAPANSRDQGARPPSSSHPAATQSEIYRGGTLSSPRRAKPSPRTAHQYSTGIVETIRLSGDPAASRILGLVESNLPPGWEHTFVLHDALVTAGALTDMARVTSFASSVDLDGQPRLALEGEALRLQQIADNVARRWLASKYPMLGTNAIESILGEPSHEVLPLLGPYNLLSDEDAVRVLGIPVKQTSPTKRARHATPDVP